MVNSLNSSIIYAGNASTSTRYPWTYEYHDPADVKVALKLAGETEFTPLNPTDYELHEDAPIGLTTVVAYPFDAQLYVYRYIDLYQPTQFPNAGSFDTEAMEKALDRLTFIAQQQLRAIGGQL